MRTKLFLAFLIVIITALVSNLIFERLIIRDFEDYSMGMREDRLYWMLASIEGSHSSEGEGWDTGALTHILRWGTILGFDLKVSDASGKDVLTSKEAIASVSPTMRRRIESLVLLDSAQGDYEMYPLFARGEEIGSLYVRGYVTLGSYGEKEVIFKNRGRAFLWISFLIAGGGALFLAIALSLFLTGPLRRLRLAAERVAQGDFTGSVKYRGHDEVGKLITSFNRMVESLKREEALRQRLTQNVAHELRTPLAVMRSNIEAMADGVVDCGAEAMDTLMAEVKRLINLVQGIEDMTRAEASFFKPVEMECVVLGDFLNGILSGLRPLFNEKGVALELEAQEEVTAEIDTEKLETVLKNIVTNALKHTNSGHVRVSSAYASEGKSVIEISDTGRGIAPDKTASIFKRFHKGEDSDGVGLGLAIARELADVMGASLDVESQVGRGTTFRITLPASGKEK